MSTVVCYKKLTPSTVCYNGKEGKFNKVKCGQNKYAYCAIVCINEDEYMITHDASTNVVVFKNDSNEIYERLKTNDRVGVQQLF